MFSIKTHSKEETQKLAQKLAKKLNAGDVVLLSGNLGVGKTTFTQGLAKTLQVKGQITSPTFVIARLHKSLQDGPDLLHVDAYRLNSLAEIQDLDLVSDLSHAVVIVEWPREMVNDLSENPIKIEIIQDPNEEDSRTINIWASQTIEEFLKS
ncbi:MAG: tRNA (adenosine(37)-N6)-threonylcarbamoyltransferase complex ATPase subunit type 1 TsaE [Candidatus Nanopelagicales bacterium]|jgi:tRNA threonylcarbamoyladenosine biosynthesis protein TsaE